MALEADVNVWTRPWEQRFQMFGGHMCNTLMAGSWDDRTPLHDAALQGRLLPLRRLLAQGHDVRIPTLDGVTPLHEACVGGHVTCAKLLLEHGADAGVVSCDGATPLFSACCAGNPALVALMLMYGCSVHHPAHRLRSPLHEAVKRGHTACVEMLLSRDVDVDLETPGEGTALYCACLFKSAECVRRLLVSGANVQCGRGLDTPLHAAVRVGGEKEVELLLEHGADRTARNSEHKTPQDLTSDKNIKHLFQTLEPCALSQLCRWRIRRSLGQKRLKNTTMLRLPRTLHNFLLYH